MPAPGFQAPAFEASMFEDASRTTAFQAYEPDRSLVGKARRRLVRLYRRRPARDDPRIPRLSITFDDAPVSATIAGAEILNARGVKGTYYISAGLLGRHGPMGRYADWSDVIRLQAEGHEIGCHTFGHTDLGQLSAQAAARCVMENSAALAAHGVPQPQTFAYPYGDVAPGPKAALGTRFSLLRALHAGLIEPGADLNQAASVGLEGPHGERDAVAWLRRAAERRAWLILNAHDVAPNPSRWGCQPEVLARVADEALALGFQIITVAEGARQVAP
jgi:peptidoglycan/xylan/chitin deacetylase (PgdA/CDA1 family)